MPLLSLVMIVKNEEERLARCLESARCVADEIVIADTGSVDATREIAARYADQLCDYEWADDFSAARNFALSHATGDWILYLDADEELLVRDVGALRLQLSEEAAAKLLLVSMRHFYGAEPADPFRAHCSVAARIFRNRAGIAFSGKIHERPVGADAEGAARGVELLHYGYLDARADEKRGRNLAFLLRERKENPDDPWTVYHIACELHGMGSHPQAVQVVNRAISEFLQAGLVPPALLYKLKYDSILAAGAYESALPAVDRAIALYPDYADLHFYKGLALFHSNRAREASEAFRHCLVLGDEDPKYLTTLGMGGFLALSLMGACHDALGEPEEARAARRQADALCPEAEALARAYLEPRTQ